MSNTPSFIYGAFSLSAHLLMGTVLGRVSVATVKHYDRKASLGGKSLLSLHFHITVHHVRKSELELKQSKNRGQELTQRLWRELVLACTGLLSPLTYKTEDHQTRDGATHNGLDPLQSITNQEKALQ